MSGVIRILQPRDHRLLGADQIGKLFLGETGSIASVINQLGDQCIHRRLLDQLAHAGIVTQKLMIKNIVCVRGRQFL